ncbi:hypothetical protein Tco_0533646 [Tanacetum coccineum]
MGIYADDASRPRLLKSPGYIADSDSMEEDTDADSIDYPNDLEDGEEDDDKDPEEDPSEEHDPEDDDDDDEDEEPTENKEEEEHPAPTDSSAVPVIDPVPSARDTEAFETDETVRLEIPISALHGGTHCLSLLPPPIPTPTIYYQAPISHGQAMIRMRDDIRGSTCHLGGGFRLTAPPPGCDVVESSDAAAARSPRRQYDFVDAVERTGFDCSPGHDARTITRAVDRHTPPPTPSTVRKKESDDFIQAFLTLGLSRRIRLEIDVVRGQRTAYETELHEVRQAYLSSEAQNRALLARLETLETHMSRMEWQRQRAEDDAVRQIMRTQVLEAKAHIDTVEDARSSC